MIATYDYSLKTFFISAYTFPINVIFFFFVEQGLDSKPEGKFVFINLIFEAFNYRVFVEKCCGWKKNQNLGKSFG